MVTKIDGIEGIGTKWWFEIFEELDDPDQLKEDILTIIESFDKDYSRFREDSTLSTLNKERFINDPSEEFLALVRAGVTLYKETNGLFNPLVGKILVDSGYDKEYSFRVASDSHLLPNIDDLFVEENLIRLDGEGQLDFGGFGKGFLIDKLANFLREDQGLSYFLINGGGDIYVTSDKGKPIEIGLQDPVDREKLLGKIPMKDQALGASSVFVRSWKDQKGKIQTHIVNTQEVGNIPSGSTFVVSDLGSMVADAYATVLSFGYTDIDLLDKVDSDPDIEYLVLRKDSRFQSDRFPEVKS